MIVVKLQCICVSVICFGFVFTSCIQPLKCPEGGVSTHLLHSHSHCQTLPLTRSRNNCRAGNKGLAAVKSTVARSILKPCERSAAAKGRQNTLTVGLSAAPRKKREHTSPPRAVFATRENNRIKAHQ